MLVHPFATITASTPQGLGVCLWAFLTFLPEPRVRSHTDVGWEGLALTLCSNSAQRCRVEVRTLCIHTKLSHPCLYGLCFVHWCTVMLEQEGAIPKLLPQSWGHGIVSMLKHSEFLSLEIRGQAQFLKNTPTPQSPLHQTLHLAQCSQASTVILATAKPRLVHQIDRWRSMIHQSRERISTALESRGGKLQTTASDALHCTC